MCNAERLREIKDVISKQQATVAGHEVSLMNTVRREEFAELTESVVGVSSKAEAPCTARPPAPPSRCPPFRGRSQFQFQFWIYSYQFFDMNCYKKRTFNTGNISRSSGYRGRQLSTNRFNKFSNLNQVWRL